MDEVKENEDILNHSKDKTEFKLNCKECDFYTDTEVNLKMHMQTTHRTARVHLKPPDISQLKCDYCEYQGKYNI